MCSAIFKSFEAKLQLYVRSRAMIKTLKLMRFIDCFCKPLYRLFYDDLECSVPIAWHYMKKSDRHILQKFSSRILKKAAHVWKTGG